MRWPSLLLGLPVAVAGSSALAQSPLGWEFGGDLTYALERYGADGNVAAAPYSMLGTQRYLEADLYFSRDLSAYERVDGELGAVANDSVYRSEHRGIVVERGHLHWEKGDARLPFEAQVGDFFAYQSLRTVQRGLKGVQLELQPKLGGDAEHSLEAFNGLAATTYRSDDFNSTRERLYGVSWVSEWEGTGAFAVNWAHLEPADSIFETYEEDVGSLAFERQLTVARQDLVAELELAHYRDQDESDSGRYFQLSGADQALPLSYRLIVERYGEHFSPGGSSVSANHRAVELRGGWRFGNGIRLRGRWQDYRDQLESDNPQDARVVGFDLSGRLLPYLSERLSGSLEAFVQEREDREGYTDDRTEALSIDLASPLGESAWSLTGGFRYVRDRDSIFDSEYVTREAWLGADWDFEYGTARGTLSPGLQVRENRGRSETLEVNPALDLSLVAGNHGLRASYNVLEQRPDLWADQRVANAAIEYSYRRGNHELRLEGDYFDRRIERAGAEDTDAYRIGLFYTLHFETAGELPAAAQGFRYQPQAVVALAGIPGPAQLRPGMPMEQIVQHMADIDAPAPVQRPGLLVYEVDVIPGVDRRQRLALEHAAGALQRATLIVDFDAVGGPKTALQSFERVRETLLRRHGRPSRRIEKGGFSADLPVDLAHGRFVRMMGWDTASGTLSFAVPRRTDGRIRMEITHSAGWRNPGTRVAQLR